MNEPLRKKQLLLEAKIAFGKGDITITQLYKAADDYIAAVNAHCKAIGKRAPRISRAGLLR